MTTHTHSARLSRAVIITAALVAALLAGCGSSSRGSSSQSGSGGGLAGGGGGGGGGIQPAPGPITKLISWAPNFGPIDPFQPPGHRWYKWVQDKDCAGLLAETKVSGSGATPVDIALYGGLAKACQGKWADAKAALATLHRNTLTPTDGVPAPDCLMASAYDALKRLVDAHEADPSATITIGGAATATCTPPAETLVKK